MTFSSLRMHDYIYTEWSSGDREYYNLTEDPYELKNGWGGLSPIRQAALKAGLMALKSGMPRPVCFIETPHSGNDSFLQRIQFDGLAESGVGVQQVRLTIADISRPRERRFWNGSDWQSDRVVLDASLANSGGVISDWTFDWSPPPAETVLRCRVTAWTIGTGKGRQSEPVFRDFWLECEDPVTAVTSPDLERTVKWMGGFPITGTAVASRPVRNVRLSLMERTTKQYWNGTGWQDKWCWVSPSMRRVGPGKVEWTYQFQPPESNGAARLVIETVLDDGRRDRTSHDIRIRWED